MRFQPNFDLVEGKSHDPWLDNMFNAWFVGMAIESNGISEEAYSKLSPEYKQFWIAMT